MLRWPSAWSAWCPPSLQTLVGPARQPAAATPAAAADAAGRTTAAARRPAASQDRCGHGPAAGVRRRAAGRRLDRRRSPAAGTRGRGIVAGQRTAADSADCRHAGRCWPTCRPTAAPRTDEPAGDLGDYRLVADHAGTATSSSPACRCRSVDEHAATASVIVAVAVAAGRAGRRGRRRRGDRPGRRCGRCDRVAATATRVAELPLDRGEVALPYGCPRRTPTPHRGRPGRRGAEPDARPRRRAR